MPESGCHFLNLKEGKLPLLPGHSLQFQNLLKVLYYPNCYWLCCCSLSSLFFWPFSLFFIFTIIGLTYLHVFEFECFFSVSFEKDVFFIFKGFYLCIFCSLLRLMSWVSFCAAWRRNFHYDWWLNAGLQQLPSIVVLMMGIIWLQVTMPKELQSKRLMTVRYGLMQVPSNMKYIKIFGSVIVWFLQPDNFVCIKL
jgi:hypothetical protein